MRVWCSRNRNLYSLLLVAIVLLLLAGASGSGPAAGAGYIRFSVNGFRYFNLVLITPTWAAPATWSAPAAVKASHTEWLPLARNWGQNWQSSSILVGGALSFRVTTSDRRTLTSWNVAGPAWRFGQTSIHSAQVGRSLQPPACKRNFF